MEKVEEATKKYDITQPVFADHEHKLTDAFENKYVTAYYVFDQTGKLRIGVNGILLFWEGGRNVELIPLLLMFGVGALAFCAP